MFLGSILHLSGIEWIIIMRGKLSSLATSLPPFQTSFYKNCRLWIIQFSNHFIGVLSWKHLLHLSLSFLCGLGSGPATKMLDFSPIFAADHFLHFIDDYIYFSCFFYCHIFFLNILAFQLNDGLEFSFTDKRRFAKVRLLDNVSYTVFLTTTYFKLIIIHVVSFPLIIAACICTPNFWIRSRCFTWTDECWWIHWFSK